MFYLLMFYLSFFFFALLLPTWRVWKQTGVNPLVLPSSDTAEGFIGRMFKIVIAALGFYFLLGAAGFITEIGPIHMPEAIRKMGWSLLFASFLWVLAAQYQMGRSWRIGIDATIKTDLVANGLFQLSRNPIFLGMIVQLLGLFLVAPDSITLSVLVAGFLLISLQIRLEEAHLTDLHGNAYDQYCRKVRRWV